MKTRKTASPRSFFNATLALVVALFFGASAVHAQDGQPEYIQQYSAAMQMAKEGSQLEQSDDIAGAVEKYEAAYRQLADVVDMAKSEGAVENANKAQQVAAQLAYRAGSLLHNDDQSEAAIAHFEFGQEVAPPTYTKNTSGLQAARNAMKAGPVADASQALANGNAREALQLLSQLDEQTSTSYFYQALAYQELGNSENAITSAGRAIDAGGLATARRRRLYLVIGEEHMKMGDDENAREALAQAADLGSDRAAALMKQL